MGLRDGRVLIICLNPFGQQSCSRSGAIAPVQIRERRLIPSCLINNNSFKPEERLVSDSSELRANCFPFDLLGVVLGPTMLDVTSRYSTSESDFFLREHRLLAELEAVTADNRWKADGLII